ncbi:MAG TPA: M50 family metallopeptidase [Candidatus Limnocylindria bacterium]|jgi:regulator of sigma E protease|nr:M50 family metallopeptidase [Candidatus Limnocylindria bacterium]
MGALLQFFQEHPLAIPLFLLMFTAIIAVHEFGHYITARLFGMRVLEFAFGFPPRLFAIRHGGIDYSINAIPFGGFVRILGQDDFSIEQRGAGEPGSFTSKPWWQQAIVLASGVAMNFVLAIVVLMAAFMIGTNVPTGIVRVDQVAPNSPAAAAGIQPGDIVRAIDDKPITRTSDLHNYVWSHTDKEVTIVIERNGRILDPLKVVPRAQPPENEGPLGVRLEDVTTPPTALPPPEAFGQAVRLTVDVVQQIAELPGQLLARPAGTPGPPPVGGPIEILRVTALVSQSGLSSFLKLVGVISVNLAVLNIIPFPGLDGGRLFFVLLRAAFRRRISPQVEAAIHAVGFVLLLGLLVVVSVADIRRATGG